MAVGVSVSAATAVVVAGLFVAFTTGYPAVANGFDRVADGEQGARERALERQQTAVLIETATFNRTRDELVVSVTNDGSVGLLVSDTTLVVDNTYVDITADTGWTTVDGQPDTDLVLPGETLTIEIPDTAVSAPLARASRVVVVTDTGVRDAADVVVK